jgi:alkylation response protein AidB-like acyl-CoA dehydrogenase
MNAHSGEHEMAEFRLDERDAAFVLFEYLDLDKLLTVEKYADYDRETCEMIVREAARFMVEQVAPHNKAADEQGAVRSEDGTVRFPDGFYDLYPAFCEAGWWAPLSNPMYGGMGLPEPVGFACNEFIDAACPAFGLIPMLTTGAAHLIESFGTDELRDLYLEKMYTGQWGGTMGLTEPHAGSNVGALTTKAIPAGDHYLLEGTKIFITNAEHDLTENIVHLVIARVEGAPAGSRGISLFLVPKYRLDDHGDPGEFNNIRCANIEHKMGIHGSPTCLINFGDGGPTEGYLIGETEKGLAYMFQLMNEARIQCGVHGAAIASAAYTATMDYARERTQGKSFLGMNPADGGQAPITGHPDVRRTLMEMRAYTEGMRALLYQTALYEDLGHSLADREEAQVYLDLLEALTPLCKAFCTDIGFHVCDQAIQTHGGYGYCQEYPVEQYLRDVKIYAIVEGTNGIQALDLVGRKLRIRNGAPARALIGRIGQGVAMVAETGKFDELAGLLLDANKTLVEVTGTLAQKGADDPLYPVINATPYLELMSRVVMAVLLGEQALVARDKLDAIEAAEGCTTDEERKALLKRNDNAVFYFNKIQTAHFFARRLLPPVYALKAEILADDRSLIDAIL